jgi:AcrR family transcriptional regulator
MTRVRALDYQDKKQTILDQAAALIARKGFGGATMIDVAEACGASKSHLYHYFSSKEELLFAIVHEHITHQARDLERIIAQRLPARQRFAQFVDSFMQNAARSRNEHIILMNDLKFLPKARREHIRKLEAQMTELLEGLLTEINPALMRQPRVRKPYALLLFGMMIWTFSWYHRNGPITPKELAQRISELYLDGFRSPMPSARSIKARATTFSAKVSSAPSKIDSTRASTK